MRRSIILPALALWLCAECVVLVSVVSVAGWTGALLIGLLTSLAGAALMKRLGLNAAQALRHIARGGQPTDGALLDGMLAAFGAMLLVLPGFLSDLVGLALAAPSARQFIARRFGAPQTLRSRAAPGVIDLTPADWRIIEPGPGER